MCFYHFETAPCSLSKNPHFQDAKVRGSVAIERKAKGKRQKAEFFQLHFASFFKFMAANFSLTHFVTAAKPR